MDLELVDRDLLAGRVLLEPRVHLIAGLARAESLAKIVAAQHPTGTPSDPLIGYIS